MLGQYDDIINLPHPEPKTRPRMSISARAAQFAPFAALTGYNDEVKESTRITDGRIELDELTKEELNRKLQLLKEKRDTKPDVSITYFVPDTKKSGGAYVTTTGYIKKIKEYERLILMPDESNIPIADIVDIQGDFYEED